MKVQNNYKLILCNVEIKYYTNKCYENSVNKHFVEIHIH